MELGVLFGTFFVLLAIGTPVAFCLGFSALATLIVMDISPVIAFQRMISGINVFALLALPFFIFAGELMTRGGIATRLLEFAEAAVGHIRGGLGIVNVRALFGDSAVKPRKFLRLIVHLEPMEAEKVRNADRLRGTERPRSMLGVDIPEVTLPVAPGRNMAVLVESTVRNHILRAKGYDSAIDFAQQHQRIIEQDS